MSLLDQLPSRPRGERAAPRALLESSVELLAGTLATQHGVCKLPRRQLEVVALLALNGPCSAEHIAASIWPDSDKQRGDKLVRVNIHRLRNRLGSSAIAMEHGSYVLSDAVGVDLRRAERELAADAPTVALMSPSERGALLEVARRMRMLDEFANPFGEWFLSHARRLAHGGRACSLRVAQRFVEQAAYSDALAILHALTCEDPCDEEARELIIRAYVLSGRLGAAAREYLRYSATLRREIGIAPNLEVEQLFRS